MRYLQYSEVLSNFRIGKTESTELLNALREARLVGKSLMILRREDCDYLETGWGRNSSKWL